MGLEENASGGKDDVVGPRWKSFPAGTPVGSAKMLMRVIWYIPIPCTITHYCIVLCGIICHGTVLCHITIMLYFYALVKLAISPFWLSFIVFSLGHSIFLTESLSLCLVFTHVFLLV